MTATPHARWERTVDQWTSVYREVYAEQGAGRFAGWTDFVTGRPIADSVMRAWLAWSVEAIARVRPRALLEIGGGTGMLVDALADSVDRYVFTDPVTGDRDHPHPGVTTVRAGAHDLARVLGADDRFDCVVVNSVVQYFPDCDYLAHVLAEIEPHLMPDAVVFLGDLRRGDLHLDQCRERARHREPFAAADRIDEVAAQIARTDPELTVTPAVIARAAAGLGDDWLLRVRPRSFDSDSELARYRFDALLKAGPGPAVRGPVRSVRNGLLTPTGPTPAEVEARGESVSLAPEDPYALWIGNDDDLWIDVADLASPETGGGR